MLTLLGIDPGSRITGYGIIWIKGSQQGCITFGHIKTPEEASVAERLHTIFEQLSRIIQEYQPSEAAIEQVFLAHQYPLRQKPGSK